MWCDKGSRKSAVSLSAAGSLLLLIIFTCSQVLLVSSLENYEINEAIERDKMRLPEFYLSKQLTQCKLDSPEQFYIQIALPTLKSLIQEGKTFFGVLLDNLDEALSEDETYDSLKKDWEYLTDVLLTSFEDRQASINWMWKKFITIANTNELPWETWSKKVVLIEVIGAIHYDYLVLEAAIRMAVREIISSSLKQPFTKIMKEVEEKVQAKYDNNGAPDSETFVRNMETTLKEVEPNFVGKLLSGILTRARMKADGIWKDYPSFVAEPIEQIGIVVIAYRNKSQDYQGSFWNELTEIMKKDTATILASAAAEEEEINQKLFLMYSKSQDRVIRNVMFLLTPKDEM